MSLAAFQSQLLRLIADPAFRDRVRARGGIRDPALTALEAKRLAAIAASPGLDVNRTLHKGFRLGKLRAMLPLTCQLLGPARLTREVSSFWRQRPPSSFSFLPEALEFCAHLQRRPARSPYLAEIVAYEQARLALEEARPDPPPVQFVHFEHDPHALLATLSAGRRPRAIPRQPCRAIGIRGEDGKPTWRIEIVVEAA